MDAVKVINNAISIDTAREMIGKVAPARAGMRKSGDPVTRQTIYDLIKKERIIKVGRGLISLDSVERHIELRLAYEGRVQ